MAEVLCPSCRTMNAAGARFCYSCGQPMPADPDATMTHAVVSPATATTPVVPHPAAPPWGPLSAASPGPGPQPSWMPTSDRGRGSPARRPGEVTSAAIVLLILGVLNALSGVAGLLLPELGTPIVLSIFALVVGIAAAAAGVGVFVRGQWVVPLGIAVSIAFVAWSLWATFDASRMLTQSDVELWIWIVFFAIAAAIVTLELFALAALVRGRWFFQQSRG